MAVFEYCILQHFEQKYSFQRIPNQTEKLRKFQGVGGEGGGGGRYATPWMEIPGGRGSKVEVPSVGRGVWIFSGTTCWQYLYLTHELIKAMRVWIIEKKKSSNRRWNSELVLIVSVDIRSVGRSLESLYKLDTLLLALSLITQWVPDEFKKWTWSDFNLDASSDLESLPKLTPLQVRKECKSFQHYWIQHCWLRILNGAVEIDG